MAQRRSFFSLVILMVVFGVLVGIYLLTMKPAGAQKQPKKIFSWKADEIMEISRWVNLTNGRELTTFVQTNGEWMLSFLLVDRVHPELFHRLLDTLAKLTSEEMFIVTNESEWASFGFSPYQYRFVVKNVSNEVCTIDVGNVSVGKNYYYVRVNNSSTNYQVYTFNLIDLLQPQGNYRWPDIFDIPFDRVERVVFTFEGKQVVELSNGNVWYMVYPQYVALSNYAVKSLLLDFYPLQADHFVSVDLSLPTLRKYGLVSSVYGVVFIGDGRSNTLFVGSKGEEGFLYAYSRERQGVFAVSESEVVSKWITQASQLRR